MKGGVEIRADEGVAAFNIMVKVRQHAGVQYFQLAGNGLLAFAFKHFQQQRKLCDLHGLRVNVDAVNIIEKDAFSLAESSVSFQSTAWHSAIIDRWISLFCPGFRIMLCVPLQMPVEQILVRANEKRARAAGGVKDAEW